MKELCLRRDTNLNRQHIVDYYVYGVEISVAVDLQEPSRA